MTTSNHDTEVERPGMTFISSDEAAFFQPAFHGILRMLLLGGRKSGQLMSLYH
jgi:hypothetical protein